MFNALFRNIKNLNGSCVPMYKEGNHKLSGDLLAIIDIIAMSSTPRQYSSKSVNKNYIFDKLVYTI